MQELNLGCELWPLPIMVLPLYIDGQACGNEQLELYGVEQQCGEGSSKVSVALYIYELR